MPNTINERTLIPSKVRVPLAQTVPLPAPFCVRIEPTRACNFRCEFCEVSLGQTKDAPEKKFMDYGLFCSIIQQIKESFGRVKSIVILGLGESLLHPRIADMVREVARNEVADTIEITTNGALLTPAMSDALIDAGLTVLRISVNGLSGEELARRCKANVDFEQYLNHIRYFYSHKKDAKLCVKILDYMVKTPERYEEFLRIFAPICDVTVVESLVEMTKEIDYSKFSGEDFQFDHTQHHTELSTTKICSMPFYTFQINCNGKVQACCNPNSPCIGDVTTTHIKEIWRKDFFAFQARMLDGTSGIPICDSCVFMKYRVLPEDVLDDHVPEIKRRYEAYTSHSASETRESADE